MVYIWYTSSIVCLFDFIGYSSLKLDIESQIHEHSSDRATVAVGNDSKLTLKDIQEKLNRIGVSEMIVTVVKKGTSTPVFMEVMLLAQALLYGGNTAVQVCVCVCVCGECVCACVITSVCACWVGYVLCAYDSHAYIMCFVDLDTASFEYWYFCVLMLYVHTVKPR